jgi:hypothetical protein
MGTKERREEGKKKKRKEGEGRDETAHIELFIQWKNLSEESRHCTRL